MWYKLSLALLLGLFALTPIEAQDWRRDRDYYPPRDRDYYPRRDRDYVPQRDRDDYPPRDRGQDSRRVWKYWIEGGGRYEQVRGRTWAQYRRSGDPIYYREVTRTPEYVELYDEGRDLPVRLYDNMMHHNIHRRGWSQGFEGAWQ